jgi:hypothetical protein
VKQLTRHFPRGKQARRWAEHLLRSGILEVDDGMGRARADARSAAPAMPALVLGLNMNADQLITSAEARLKRSLRAIGAKRTFSEPRTPGLIYLQGPS